MFYTFIRYVAAGVVWLINGRYTLTGQDKLPQGNYILVGPHRTWWDPIFFALAAWPHKFSFMAKKELQESYFTLDFGSRQCFFR